MCFTCLQEDSHAKFSGQPVYAKPESIGVLFSHLAMPAVPAHYPKSEESAFNSLLDSAPYFSEIGRTGLIFWAGCVALCYDGFSEKLKLSNVELS